jgi:hypothetical protein
LVVVALVPYTPVAPATSHVFAAAFVHRDAIAAAALPDVTVTAGIVDHAAVFSRKNVACRVGPTADPVVPPPPATFVISVHPDGVLIVAVSGFATTVMSTPSPSASDAGKPGVTEVEPVPTDPTET